MIPAKSRRTCRYCSPHEVFRSITLLVDHCITEHPDKEPPAAPAYKRVDEKVILTAISSHTRQVVRGPTGPELMKIIGLSRRSVYDRLAQLKASGLVQETEGEGFMLTLAGTTKLFKKAGS